MANGNGNGEGYIVLPKRWTITGVVAVVVVMVGGYVDLRVGAALRQERIERNEKAREAADMLIIRRIERLEDDKTAVELRTQTLLREISDRLARIEGAVKSPGARP